MNKAWERALFGQTRSLSPVQLRQITGERITKYSQTVETARRMAATARTSKERAIQLGIASEACGHLRALLPFMSREQKKRVAPYLEKTD